MNTIATPWGQAQPARPAMTRDHPNGDPKGEPVNDNSFVHPVTSADIKEALRRVDERRRLRRKPQQFDVSPLPLFGDGHTQKELF